jgi:hypothetical protein
MGSILDARHAGIELAASATIVRNKHTEIKITGSFALTRNSNPDKKRVSSKEPPMPAAIPMIVMRNPYARINRTMLAFVAPVAIRTPISYVRCETEYDINP